MENFDTGFDDNLGKSDKTGGSIIHIRVQQRRAHKWITTIQGISPEFDLKKILRAFKKNFNCNGTIVTDEEKGDEIIQLTGDQRHACADFFIQEGIALNKELVKVHGA